VAQVTLSLVLLAGAGLLLRSLQRLQQVDTGLAPEGVVTVSLSAFRPGSNDDRIRGTTQLYERLAERLGRLPGVVAVGGTDNFPFSGTVYGQRGGRTVEARGEGDAERRFRAPALLVDVTPGYFEAVGIPLLEGRAFNGGDDLDAPEVIILSRRAAESLFPGRPAVGQEVRVTFDGGGADNWSRVVGVVGNVKHDQRWDDRGIELYYPHSQYGLAETVLALRTRGATGGLERQIRAAVAEVDPEVAVEGITTLQGMIDDTLWQDRVWSLLLASFAFTALVLAALGLYGVLAESVAQRTRELGIRLALGAVPRAVVARVTREGLSLVAIGLGLGLVATPLAARALGNLLFGVEPTALGPMLVAVAALLVAALLACALPALRAARVDPWRALRHE
jgi:putative ABC transport system permease protein